MDLRNDHGAASARTLETPARTGHAQEAVCLSALWTELISGLCKIEETAFTSQSCTLVVSRGHSLAGHEPPALTERQASILQRSLVEGARKSVAMDLGLCPSSVAEILKQGFTFMGLSCWPSRIPLLVVMAAHAHGAPELDSEAGVLLAENQRFSRQTVSADRPDNELVQHLSPAEYAVTRLLVEGKSYADMAVPRRTSVRTVANQLAAAFHRLGISGRAELLCLLAKRKLAGWQLSTPGASGAPAGPEPTSGFFRVTYDDDR